MRWAPISFGRTAPWIESVMLVYILKGDYHFTFRVHIGGQHCKVVPIIFHSTMEGSDSYGVVIGLGDSSIKFKFLRNLNATKTVGTGLSEFKFVC